MLKRWGLQLHRLAYAVGSGFRLTGSQISGSQVPVHWPLTHAGNMFKVRVSDQLLKAKSGLSAMGLWHAYGIDLLPRKSLCSVVWGTKARRCS